MIEGKRVKHKNLQNGEGNFLNGLEKFDEAKLDLDPIAYLESKMAPMKTPKSSAPLKPKVDSSQSVKGSSTSVVLPVLHIEGKYLYVLIEYDTIIFECMRNHHCVSERLTFR